MNISVSVLIAVLAFITLPTVGIARLASWRRSGRTGLGAIVCSGFAIPAIIVIYASVDATRSIAGYGDGILLLGAAAITPLTILIAFFVVRQQNKHRASG